MEVIHWLGWGAAVAFAVGYVRVNGLLTEALELMGRLVASAEKVKRLVEVLEDQRDYWRDVAVGLEAELDELRAIRNPASEPESSENGTPRNR